MDISKLEVTYPLKLTNTEKISVLSAFRLAHPNEVRAWTVTENEFLNSGDDPLFDISNLFRQFVVQNTKCESNMASYSLFGDLRLLVKEL